MAAFPKKNPDRSNMSKTYQKISFFLTSLEIGSKDLDSVLNKINA